MEQSSVSNRLLRTMSAADFLRLSPTFELVTTKLGQSFIEPHVPIRHLFFPETGFVSVTTNGSSNKVEVGLIGREGLVGAAPVILGSDTTPYVHFVQASGTGWCIAIDPFRAALDDSVALRAMMLHYIQTLLIQTAQTAFVNASYNIEARLARWLLMCQDRLGGDEMSITHEFLSMMLGVQRTSVTLALQTLEGAGLVRARRGRIEVRDRDQLVATADAGYGVPEAEYARLIG